MPLYQRPINRYTADALSKKLRPGLHLSSFRRVRAQLSSHTLIQGMDLPQPFIARMQSLLGEQSQLFLDSLALPAVTGLRVNSIKITPPEFNRIFPFKLSPVPWCPDGFSVDMETDMAGQVSPGKHPYHTAGLYYLQEPSAMAAAQVLSPQPGETVLDLSAAPGGKATHLAALMKNTGLLVANEIHPKRVWDLAENLERCGVINAIITNETPARLAEHFEGYFDRVLLDAPCSGEGMFRKGQVARSEWNPGLAQSCAVRQVAILKHAARLVKPDGHLSYCTCTFSPDENEGVVADFLDRHPEFDLADIHAYPGFQPARPDWIGLPAKHPLHRSVRLWPHLVHAEGHFIALLVKHGTSPNVQFRNKVTSRPKPAPTRRPKLPDSAISAWQDFCHAHLSIPPAGSDIILEGSYLYQLPPNAPSLAGVNVIKPGLWLGSLKQDRFLPSHSLAMALTAQQVKHHLDLAVDDRRLAGYLAGETIPDPGQDAWVLVTVEGFPLGWGKRVKQVIKNYYPHGLRRHN